MLNVLYIMDAYIKHHYYLWNSFFHKIKLYFFREMLLQLQSFQTVQWQVSEEEEKNHHFTAFELIKVEWIDIK